MVLARVISRSSWLNRRRFLRRQVRGSMLRTWSFSEHKKNRRLGGHDFSRLLFAYELYLSGVLFR